MVTVKKEYTAPRINVTRVDVEAVLLSESKQEEGADIDFAKEHDGFFGDWSWDDDAEKAPKRKSLWD